MYTALICHKETAHVLLILLHFFSSFRQLCKHLTVLEFIEDIQLHCTTYTMIQQNVMGILPIHTGIALKGLWGSHTCQSTFRDRDRDLKKASTCPQNTRIPVSSSALPSCDMNLNYDVDLIPKHKCGTHPKSLFNARVGHLRSISRNKRAQWQQHHCW